MTLTRTQERLLKFFASYSESEGRPPSFQDMCDFLGFRSKNAIALQMDQLEAKGFVDQCKRFRAGRGSQRARMTQLTDRAREFLGIPKRKPRIVRAQRPGKCGDCGFETFAATCFGCKFLLQKRSA